MGNYLAAVWECRFFWMAQVRRDLRNRYRRSMIGMGWSLLQPIFMTIILCTAFHAIFHADVKEYGVYVLSGIAFWNYIMAVTVGGCSCFLLSEAYIRQHPAPLAIYPIRSALGAAIHFVIALTVVVAATWLFQGFGNLASLVWLLITVPLLVVFGWSMAVLMGFAHAFFYDTQHIAEVSFQVLFYATPIIYKPSNLSNSPMVWALHLNPLSSLLQMIRDPILNGHAPAAATLMAATATVAVCFGAAVLTLNRLQERLIFRL